MVDYYTGDKGWVHFYAMLSELPSHAKFPSAVSQDPELARSKISSLTEEDIREIMERRHNPEESTLDHEGYTMEIETLNQVVEEVRLLRMAMSGSKDRKFKSQKRPKTEQDILLEQRIEMLEERDRNSMERDMGF